MIPSGWPCSATLTNGDTVINLFDAPGNPDYVGELRAGLRAADAAVFVVSAADGIDMTTQILWNECASVGMPRAIVVTKLDTERASFEQTVQQCQEVFGAGVHPAYLPFIGEKDQDRRKPVAAEPQGARLLVRQPHLAQR